MDFDSIKKFDWRTLGKYFNPKATDDFNHFLEKLPQHTSKAVLIMVGVVWGSAAGLGLFTMVKMQEFSAISVEHEEAQALLPNVPVIKDTPIQASEVSSFVDELQKTYKGLEIKGNSSNIIITARSTAQFGEFREAIGHVQNGGIGWRVNIDRLCVGKECQQYPLAASLKINQVSVQ